LIWTQPVSPLFDVGDEHLRLLNSIGGEAPDRLVPCEDVEPFVCLPHEFVEPQPVLDSFGREHRFEL
jgi:hypothetical protein